MRPRTLTEMRNGFLSESSLDNDIDEGGNANDKMAVLPILRMLAETQRQMVGREGNGRRHLPEQILEEVGEPPTTSSWSHRS